MLYTKMVDGKSVLMSDAEIAERKAEEAAWAAMAAQRAVEHIEAQCGALARWERDVILATLPVDHPKRVQVEAAEKSIAALGVRKA